MRSGFGELTQDELPQIVRLHVYHVNSGWFALVFLIYFYTILSFEHYFLTLGKIFFFQVTVIVFFFLIYYYYFLIN
jgi:hypothetical protein